MKPILLSIIGLLFISQLNAHPGVGIVMDSRGSIFYTDLEHVWRISPEGNLSIAVENVHTHELYIDEDDNLYGEHEWYEGEATDKWGNYVWCLSSSGELQQSIPPVEGFLDNNTLVRDSLGNSYFSEKSDEKYLLKIETPNGQVTSFTSHHFEDIRWMYYSKHNASLYIIDHLTLVKVSRSGDVELLIENLKEKGNVFNRVADRHYANGIWTDHNMNVNLALYGAGFVKQIGPDGSISTIYKSPSGWSPCGGLTTADGSLYIMEFSVRNKTRVRKIYPDGKEQLFSN